MSFEGGEAEKEKAKKPMERSEALHMDLEKDYDVHAKEQQVKLPEAGKLFCKLCF